MTALQLDTIPGELAIAAGTSPVGPDMQQLWQAFPPRPVATRWPAPSLCSAQKSA